MISGSPKLAVLIDGDNVSPGAMEELFTRVASRGHAMIRNVYGSQAGKQKWLEAASLFALSQGRRHLHATGRNATDIEMVIGAMDIMAKGNVDGFCLVSSDSDFTSLAIRLREGGKLVFGFGDARAPDTLRHACDGFHLLDVKSKSTPPPTMPAQRLLPLEQAIGWLNEAFDACASDGWATLPDVANHLKAHHSGFSPKNYGSTGMKKLITTCGAFEFERVRNRDLFQPTKAAKALKLVKT